MSVSATTRQKRPGETAGTDYHFVDPTEFGLMVNRGELLEHAKVFDNYYGTPKAPVFACLARRARRAVRHRLAGHAAGARRTRATTCVSVFILPPSTRELEQRLKTRAQDSAEVVAGRMAKAADEMSHWAEYDYIIVNRDIEESVDQACARSSPPSA